MLQELRDLAFAAFAKLDRPPTFEDWEACRPAKGLIDAEKRKLIHRHLMAAQLLAEEVCE